MGERSKVRKETTKEEPEKEQDTGKRQEVTTVNGPNLRMGEEEIRM